MKRVLMIAGVLVLSLGALVLWLSIEPPPELPSRPAEATGESNKPPSQPTRATKTNRDDSRNPESRLLTQPVPSEPEKDTGFRPITELRSDSDRTQSEMAAPSAHDSAPGSSREDVQGGDSTKTAATVAAGTQAASKTPGTSPAGKGPQSTTAAVVQPILPQEPGVARGSQETQQTTAEQKQLQAAPPPPTPALASDTAAPRQRPQPSVRRQRSPAPPGRYETITTATARVEPDAASPIVNSIRRGTILNVTGSSGDWLIVYSKTKNITVYVRRDEAMLSQRPVPLSADVPESQWPDVEQAIRQAFVKNNVLGVQVTFIADTAYLKGTVKTDRERERAEIFARSVLEVKHVFNGIRVE